MSISFATVYTRASVGINAPLVRVEAHISNGLPKFNIVGLPDTAVRESKERVRSAIINSQFDFPYRRITVNLAPAELPKDGSGFDLPIALGILLASHQLKLPQLDQYEFVGELALNGELRFIRGALPLALAAERAGRCAIFPQANNAELGLVSSANIFTANHLLDVCNYFMAQKPLQAVAPINFTDKTTASLDLGDVQGQHRAKRALEIAAAGQHNLIFYGPPGSGKTMLASRLPSILPPLTRDEACDVVSIYSISGKNYDLQTGSSRPFRAPHHSASLAALVGGGNPPKPGEITLSHGGVLFLDELPEFQRNALEALREPLESGQIVISRASSQLQFPACFQLVAAMNLCPCGYLGDNLRACSCTPEKINRYQSRISGPFWDRLDLHVEVAPVPKNLLLNNNLLAVEPSHVVRQRVIDARQKQLQRAALLNAQLKNNEIKAFCQLNTDSINFFEQATDALKLSARACHRVLKVARTIADLESSDEIKQQHLAEALSYRSK